jgi:hypothetical protein
MIRSGACAGAASRLRLGTGRVVGVAADAGGGGIGLASMYDGWMTGRNGSSMLLASGPTSSTTITPACTAIDTGRVPDKRPGPIMRELLSRRSL